MKPCLKPFTTKLAIGAFTLGVSVCANAQTQSRIIVGYPPGGALDAVARILAERFSEALGRAFVVENRAGAAGTIGAEALKGAAADGSLLLVAPDSNISVHPHVTRKPTYHAPTDFVAIAHAGEYRIALAVHAGVPAADIKSFVAHTKTLAAPAGYGSPGAGTNVHFYGVLFSQVTGANMNHVPYRGTAPALLDLVAGHIPAAMLPMGAMLPQARAGKVRVLGQSGDARSPSLADAPTFKEAGLPMLAFSGWYGLFAPAGMKPDLVDRYNELVVRAIRAPEIRERIRKFELDLRELSATEFQAMVRVDHERWGPIIRNSGFTAASE